ncbi:MAG TPA: hypothetical protein VH208_08205 [Myxococcaceae bacterium]|nr:hypothetical protein [Myxococcaceae bacterium]
MDRALDSWTSPSRRARKALGLLPCLLLAGLLALLFAPASSRAAITTFGSPLSVPATLTTSDGLGYRGTDTPVPPNPEAPNGLFHTAHFGADTALWNVRVAGGQAGAPVAGQALKVRVEGCANAAPGGAAPLTQIHLQDLSPLPDGGARVNISSQAFDLPVCGQNGAGASTVTTFEPINLCVAQGDYVSFNDNGGYVPNVYRSGVPYQVIGAVPGSTMDSFIRSNGTGNGSTLSGRDTSANDGFASNANEELMLQVIEGSGPDATHICAGGTAGRPAALAPLKIRPQTDGVNHSRVINVAVYCRPAGGCAGLAVLGLSGKTSGYGQTAFTLPGNKTSHLAIRVAPRLMSMIRRRHGVSAVLTATMGGQTFSQAITIKIL